MKITKILALGFLLAALSFAALAQDETMTNQQVVELSKAGLNKNIIIGKIRSSKTNFDVSTDALISLKKEGVEDDIVAAMMEAKSGKTMPSASGASAAASDPGDPASPRGHGIYLMQEKEGRKVMTQLAPNVTAQTRTGGLFTSSLTYGIGKVKIKANLPGTAANLQIQQNRPVFYFYLDKSSGGLNTSSGIPSTPNEFVLVKFNVRSDNREITIGKGNAFGAKGGLSDEYVMPFDAEDMGNGVFKITPRADLKNGEYGFYLTNSGSSNASSGVGLKFFDFGVRLTP